jgi:23S rRNA (uracil1939-C5)-methyltransferase
LRVRVHIDEQGRVGFLGRGSHRVVETARCAVARPELEQALERVHAAARRHPDSAALFAEAEIRVAPAGPSPVVRLAPRAARSSNAAMKGRAPAANLTTNAFVEDLREHARVVLAGEASDVEQRFPLGGGDWLVVPVASFVQVNWEVNSEIVRAVVDGARARGAATFLDLYAGAGNFTLPLLRAGLGGLSVESDAQAAGAARRAGDQAGLAAEVLPLSAERAFGRLTAEGRRFDLVVLDPPRSGAAAIVPALIELGPAAIAYCSCDPPTWARDLRMLVQGGYRLHGVAAFDMFPETHHVETLAWLEREGQGGPLPRSKFGPAPTGPG